MLSVLLEDHRVPDTHLTLMVDCARLVFKQRSWLSRLLQEHGPLHHLGLRRLQRIRQVVDHGAALCTQLFIHYFAHIGVHEGIRVSLDRCLAELNIGQPHAPMVVQCLLGADVVERVLHVRLGGHRWLIIVVLKHRCGLLSVVSGWASLLLDQDGIAVSIGRTHRSVHRCRLNSSRLKLG